MPGDLYCGDSLAVMRDHVANGTVDLVYLDPPFNSDRSYDITHKGSQRRERAFVDTWTWDAAAEAAFRESASRIAALRALKEVLAGRRDMLAYLSMMAVRLVETHRVLEETGLLYLHCDPTASHYLKLVLDGIFGAQNFRNEIVWRRSQPKGHTSVRFPRSHDVLLFYAKSEQAKLNKPYVAHDPEYVQKFYRFVEPETGRRYQLGDATNPNKDRPNLTYEFPPGSGTVRVWRWTKERMMAAHKRGEVVVPKDGGTARVKRYLDAMKGSPVTDVWSDIEHLHGAHEEATGYPTQKPRLLLRRIIESSSEPGDLVLDPFCGCGTTIEVAEELGRRWIGIDVSRRALTATRARLTG
jgi:site-specific DNA-methyltransferase (adenine-specific)